MDESKIEWTFGGKELVVKTLRIAFREYLSAFVFFAIVIALRHVWVGEEFIISLSAFIGVCLFTFVIGIGNLEYTGGTSPIFYLIRDGLYRKSVYCLNDKGLEIYKSGKKYLYHFDDLESFDSQELPPTKHSFYKIRGVRFWLDGKVVKKKFLNTQKVVLVYATLENYKEVKEFLKLKLKTRSESVTKEKSFVLWSRGKHN